MNVRGVNAAKSILRNRSSSSKFGAFTSSQLHSTASAALPLKSYEEVQIPVPWGHISGKWWGRRDVTPVLGLHGFEDNAGTYDGLASLLDVPGFLALDAPGHGKSSHAPCGMAYTFIDFVIALRRVVQHYGWSKLSIIGHSFGSATTHIYSSLYPSNVDKFVSLDCARTLMALYPTRGKYGLSLLKKISEVTIKADRDVGKDPPAYTYENMVDAFCKATQDSVEKEHAGPLLQRGSMAHPQQPQNFYFSRDSKLRYGDFCRPNLETLQESAKNIKCHVLTVLGTQGFVNVLSDADAGKAYFHLEKLVEKSAASYSRVNVEGTHHVHLNNPERVAPHINKFLAQ
ncbi:probable serine hydrolase [Thrips palmi]|uniref:Probable serine hydrolase n=1 Tax=Thrips palmi TaxID=161013 RepID=A0A6P8Y583_THRPL|nr:probable serine hydrolase [Thrips palmi]XP_034231626.1 probable serine hydrolase [Thrips palmi]XP_034231627.1 probable serine hydrolase [Thrips palmi]